MLAADEITGFALAISIVGGDYAHVSSLHCPSPLTSQHCHFCHHLPQSKDINHGTSALPGHGSTGFHSLVPPEIIHKRGWMNASLKRDVGRFAASTRSVQTVWGAERSKLPLLLHLEILTANFLFHICTASGTAGCQFTVCIRVTTSASKKPPKSVLLLTVETNFSPN